MEYRISTPINVMLYEARETPLKFRFTYLSKKFLIKCFSRKLNPVIFCLEALKSDTTSKTNRITLLRSFPIFKTFITVLYIRKGIYCSKFLPSFSYNFETSITSIRPCMDMFPCDGFLFSSKIQSLFLMRSSYSDNAVTFYTDKSKQCFRMRYLLIRIKF